MVFVILYIKSKKKRVSLLSLQLSKLVCVPVVLFMGSESALMESWQTPSLRLCFEVIRCAWLTWETADFMLPWAYFLPCFWQWEELGIKPSFPGSTLSFISVCGASINKTVVLSSTLETAPRLYFALFETFAAAAACSNRQILFPSGDTDLPSLSQSLQCLIWKAQALG